MTERYSSEALDRLYHSENYRDFIRVAIEERGKALNRKFGYADISRLAGFSARSFPREVVIGKKNISLNSLPSFIKALGLNQNLAQYFKLLVEKEHPEYRSNSTSLPRIQKLQTQLRSRHVSKRAPTSSSKKQVFAKIEFPIIYSALGSLERGASLEEIKKRTGLQIKIIRDFLQEMLSHSLISEQKGRYYAIENLIHIQSLTDQDLFYSYYRAGALGALEKSEKNFNSEDQLYFQGVFSVNQAKLPALKSELREVLLRFIAENEMEDGNTVTQINCSMI